jgi:hypothetical protein
MTNNVSDESKISKNSIKCLDKSCPIRFEFEEEEGQDKLKNATIKDNLPFKEALESVFGTRELDIIDEIINKSVNAMGDLPREKKTNTLVQALADCNPKNTIEAKLLAQAQVLFSQGMRLINFANSENMLFQQAHYMKFALQCLKLHNETVLALDKFQRKGEQKVVVQHVNVEGGQNAFMTGNFHPGGHEKKSGE